MISLLFEKTKKLAHLVLDYSIFVIYKYENVQEASSLSLDDYEFCEITTQDLENCQAEVIKEQSWYGGNGARIYACIMNQQVVSISAYWFGERYSERNFWPLKKNEAKLVQLYTAPEARGKGIAQRLIQYSSQQMILKGFSTLYARVWHSNYPSRKAFERNSWAVVATVIEIRPIKSLKPIRMRFNRRT